MSQPRDELGKAIQNHDLKQTLAILNSGVKVNDPLEFDSILFPGTVVQKPPLVFAAESAFKSGIEPLIMRGADINARDNERLTALHHAEDIDIVKLLLDNEADVDAKDAAGDTALCNRVWSLRISGRIETVKLLLKYKADPYSSGSRDGIARLTPLEVARHCFGEPMVTLFEEHLARTELFVDSCAASAGLPKSCTKSD